MRIWKLLSVCVVIALAALPFAYATDSQNIGGLDEPSPDWPDPYTHVDHVNTFLPYMRGEVEFWETMARPQWDLELSARRAALAEMAADAVAYGHPNAAEIVDACLAGRDALANDVIDGVEGAELWLTCYLGADDQAALVASYTEQARVHWVEAERLHILQSNYTAALPHYAAASQDLGMAHDVHLYGMNPNYSERGRIWYEDKARDRVDASDNHYETASQAFNSY